jgi:2'-5' RNA ligase
MPVRSFIALPLPEPVAAALGDDAARLASQDKDGRVRWVGEENYHVTLAFLGDIDEPVLDDLAIELENRLAGFGEVDIRVESVALFPYGKRPRLIAAMIEASDQLQTLHKLVLKAVRRLPIPQEKRRFHPHVTLGRLRTGRGRSLNIPPASVSQQGTVDVATVYESTLTARGSIYDPLYEIRLDVSTDRDYMQLGTER